MYALEANPTAIIQALKDDPRRLSAYVAATQAIMAVKGGSRALAAYAAMAIEAATQPGHVIEASCRDVAQATAAVAPIDGASASKLITGLIAKGLLEPVRAIAGSASRRFRVTALSNCSPEPSPQNEISRPPILGNNITRPASTPKKAAGCAQTNPPANGLYVVDHKLTAAWQQAVARFQGGKVDEAMLQSAMPVRIRKTSHAVILVPNDFVVDAIKELVPQLDLGEEATVRVGSIRDCPAPRRKERSAMPGPTEDRTAVRQLSDGELAEIVEFAFTDPCVSSPKELIPYFLFQMTHSSSAKRPFQCSWKGVMSMVRKGTFKQPIGFHGDKVRGHWIRADGLMRRRKEQGGQLAA